ncbi:hypothetical protein L596_023400 [Steinernema carpocapsae]|uniref:RNA-directed RNA polymerase n=1 Tax=Steinernema carpocapsae TaxID=34508 RepID=A0A4V5ZZE4_STECR|nr:hypothetical protein L596_023400 [Steinernema carpocapsae]
MPENGHNRDCNQYFDGMENAQGTVASLWRLHIKNPIGFHHSSSSAITQMLGFLSAPEQLFFISHVSFAVVLLQSVKRIRGPKHSSVVITTAEDDTNHQCPSDFMSADSDSSANAKTSGVIRIFLDRTYERYDRCTELQHYVLEKLTREETFQTFTLKRNGLPRHHKGDYEERLSEYELTRMPPPKNADKSKEPWDREEYPPRKRLLQLVTEFTEALSATMKGPLPAIMQISDDFFLKKDYDPIDENLRVAEFALGNLVDPFTFHYSELKSSTDDKAQHDTHILRSFMKDNNIKSGMIATFEHDKNILWIRCVHWQKNPQAVYGVSLKVPYNQIRRLIIDVDKKADCATIYFCLNYPVEIRRAKMKSQKGRNMSAFGTEFDRKGRDGERCLSWEGEDSENGRLKQAIADSPVLALTLTDYKDEGFYNVLSRLRSRCKVPEFTHVHKEKRSDYVDPPDVLLHLRTKSGKLNDFSVAYFVQAVFSRGALVKDALLRSEDVRNKFIAKICKQCDKNRIVAVCALERFLNAIDEKRELRDPIKLWDFLVNQVSGDIGTIQKQLDKNEKDGYTLVRKAVVTPSRILLLTPELIMGNRGLRDFVNNSDDVIRVLFRDEDGTQMRKISVGEIIIQKVVGQVLEDGIRIAGRHLCYLGSSNSQLRDNGCYFFEKSQIPDIRKKMGTFKEMSVPKRMSRMGQFFTQAQRVQRPLERKEYRESYDLIGGADLVNEPYTFSDGVGVMSVALGEEFSRSLKLNGCVPSCFQIRYRGFKGVLSVNPMLDEIRAWAEANLSDEDIPKYRNNVVFRSSQKKFDASKNAKLDSAPFEVVKYSAPCQISLNRPMIDILDQVSEIQSYKAHERIWSRIDELFEKQVAKAASSLTSEHYARERLAELPKRIGTSDLKEEDGFMLTQEPFFRSLIMSSVRLSMSKLRKKNNVDIPSNLGRLVYGIVDETGQLQYNQIFCQVSSSIFVKHPKKSALKRILKGPVMMTKNPAIVKGDIRRFEAVDIPELRHLVDVVVFPRYGPRSMPDEMAGSDLDGDEYVIIWDPKFLFDKNEAAMNYPRPLKTFEKVREDEIEKKSCEFFIKYIIQDAVGMLAHAFLANSDYYGIESEVCENVARKHAKALDFPKTGDQPDALTKMPTKSEIYEGKQIPQEKPDRYPDFMEKDHQRCYASIGLNGHIYRRARALDDILHRSVDRHLSDKIEVDPDLIVDGWEDYEDEAKKTMNDYNSQIRSVLETYGIEDEGQLFSGAISKMRSGVGDATQDKDLFGAFNVLSTVSKHVALIFDEFRRSFFDEHGFGGYLHCTDLKYETVGRSDEMHHSYKRTCRKPTLEMKKLASAYYKLTYEAARQESQQAVKLLSFPWTVWDVLAAIKHDVAEEKRRSSDRRDQYMNRRVKPFANLLSEHIAKFCRQRQEDLDDFKNLLVNTDGIIALMLERYEGLVSILFFVCVWADDSNVFSDFFNYQHLCWILILFGQGIYPWNHAKTFHTDLPIFYPIDKLKEVQNIGKESVNLNHLLGGIGSVILLFLEFLSSYYFGHKMKSISFNPLGLNSSLGSCYLQKLFHAATKTYNEVIFSVSFDTLPQPEEGKVHRSLREFEIEPFMIELPLQKESEGSEARYNLSDVEDQIKEMTGASHVRVRPLNDVFLSGVTRLMVSAKGTLESSQKLRTLLSVMPSCRNEHNAKWGKLFMSERLLMRLNLVHS